MHTGRILTWGGYALALAAAPLVFSSSLSLQVLSQVGIAIIACLSYGLLLGQGGLLSFGHAVYSGAGAFLAIHTLNALGAGRLGLPVSLLPLAGGVAALAVGSVFGWLSTRRAGTPFAMITLGLGELAWAASLMFTGVFGGEGGISSNRVVGARPWGISFGPQLQLYGLIAAYAFASTALMFAFTRTPLGRVLNAVRDNPERVEFLGFDPRVVRWIAFMVSSFFAGVAGALAALNFEIVTAEVFSAHRSGAYLLFTFLGGATLFWGPIVGAVLMVLAQVLLSGLTQAWLLYMGLAFVLVVLKAPGGLAGLAVAGWRLARAGRLRGQWVGALGLAATGLAGLAGAAALVEMTYHRKLDAALDPATPFLGLMLDSAQPEAWVGATLLMVCGLGLFELARRVMVRRHAVLPGARREPEGADPCEEGDPAVTGEARP